jgi:c-di-GMP-binding flagellar brake protein YcgR
MNERRKNMRAFLSFPVECSFLSQEGYFYTVSKDLSENGARILCNEFLSKNNLLKVNINFIDRVLGLKAKVVWCNQERISERYIAGLEFEAMTAQNKEYLSSLVK